MNYGGNEADQPKLLFPLDPCDMQLKQRHCPPLALFNNNFGHFVNSELLANNFGTSKSSIAQQDCLFNLVKPPISEGSVSLANDEFRANYLSQIGPHFLAPTNLPNILDQQNFERILSEMKQQKTDAQVPHIPNGNSLRMCRGCEMPIQDRHLLCVHRPRHFANFGNTAEAENEFWHENCLRCYQCERQMDTGESCFVREGRVYCREDHSKSFGTSACRPHCSRCALPIGPAELVFRSGPSYVFHTHCFKCSCCGSAFTKGDQYTNMAGELICQRDLHLMQLQRQLREGDIVNGTNCIGEVGKMPRTNTIRQEASSAQQDAIHFHHISPFPDLDFSALQRPIFHHHNGDRSKKIPKRPRTILNAPQRKAFKIAFEKGPKPSRKVREQLARETGLSVRVVQVWFQNQRAKMKKERKREMDKHQSTGEGDSVSTSTDSEKKEDSDQTMPKSPLSETSEKSDMVADDDEFDEYGEEEGCNGNRNDIFCRDNEMEEAHKEKQIKQQNPIEKIHNMCQTFFSFVQ